MRDNIETGVATVAGATASAMGFFDMVHVACSIAMLVCSIIFICFKIRGQQLDNDQKRLTIKEHEISMNSAESDVEQPSHI